MFSCHVIIDFATTLTNYTGKIRERQQQIDREATVASGEQEALQPDNMLKWGKDRTLETLLLSNCNSTQPQSMVKRQALCYDKSFGGFGTKLQKHPWYQTADSSTKWLIVRTSWIYGHTSLAFCLTSGTQLVTSLSATTVVGLLSHQFQHKLNQWWCLTNSTKVPSSSLLDTYWLNSDAENFTIELQ